MTRTAVAAPAAEPFEELFAFIDKLNVSELGGLTALLFGMGSGVTFGPGDLAPCGECRKGFCDQCADCLFHETFA